MAKNIIDLPNVEVADGDTIFDVGTGEMMIYDGTWKYHNPSFYINDSNGEHVLEITHDGEVIWHGDPSDAAETFCNGVTFNFETKEGFRTKRQEWQESHRKSLHKALEEGELTKEKIDEIFAKHKFHGRLKGEE